MLFAQFTLLSLLAVSSSLGAFVNPRNYGLGAILPKYRPAGITAVGDEYLKYVDIPKQFDAREQWPECESLREIRDQGSCGSCVLQATAAAMTDRYCIHSNGKQNFHFSAEHLLTCVTNKYLCYLGAQTNAGWDFYQNKGVVSGGGFHSEQGCQPLETIVTKFVTCHDECTNSKYNVAFNKDLRYGNQPQYFATPDAVQREILTNGPVTGAFDVYDDFYYFDAETEVYEHTSGSKIGGHQIKIIGWGEQNGIDYWLLANSWSANWGDNGYFKMVRGKNNCNIEQYIMAATPIYP